MTVKFEYVKNLIKLYTPEPGYRSDGKIWTRTFDDGDWEDCVRFCSTRKTKLWTAGEAAEFRHDSYGKIEDSGDSRDPEHRSLHQRVYTGTLIGTAKDGKAGVRAYVWEPTSQELEGLVNEPLPFQIDIRNSLFQKMKRFADSTGRTFILPNELNQCFGSMFLELDVRSDSNSLSEYSENPIVNCVMGNSAARKDAVYFLRVRPGMDATPISFGVDPNRVLRGKAHIRPVILGGPGILHYELGNIPMLCPAVFLDENFHAEYCGGRGIRDQN